MKYLLLLAAQVQPSAPPIITAPVRPAITYTAPASEAAIVRFLPGAATCAGALQKPLLQEEPLPAGLFLPMAEEARRRLPGTLSFSFRIDPDGRPLTIRNVSAGENHYPLDVRDVAPALSAWRFKPGQERSDCRIGFSVRAQPVRTAGMEDLHRYLALQRPRAPGFNPAVGRTAFERVKPAGSDCFTPPRNNVREQHHPAFEEIPQPAGTSAYSFLNFEIGPTGSTENVKIVGSSGNPELDRQSANAISKWRFAPGRKAGCTFSYFRRQNAPLPAPEPSPAKAYLPAGSACPAGGPKWQSIPPLVFPVEFERRAIEGWAVVSYDLAPWGAAGNVKVLASEPAEQFGAQAASIVSRAKTPATPTGRSGCVQTIRFKIAPEPGDGRSSGGSSGAS